MNIKGLLELNRRNLPILRNTFVFHKLDEVPQEHLAKYGDEKRWVMRGFDADAQITDSPYKIKDPRVYGFSRYQIKEVFNTINKALDEKQVKSERIYLICEVFFDDNVVFSGHAMRNRNLVYIDVANGNRPSNTDWTPDKSFVVDLSNPQIFAAADYKESVERIAKDLSALPDNSYVDFTLLKDGYFLYHDLYLIENVMGRKA